jgi:hypothetical protein
LAKFSWSLFLFRLRQSASRLSACGRQPVVATAMAARRNAGFWLACTAVAVGFLSVVHAEVKNIAAGPPPPPLYYSSFGVVQVNWTFALTAGTTVTGFEVTVRPLDHTEPFTVAPPSGKNPWFWVSFSSHVLWMHLVALL